MAIITSQDTKKVHVQGKSEVKMYLFINIQGVAVEGYTKYILSKDDRAHLH